MGVTLFIATPTGTCRLALRRFRLRGQQGEHYHNATVVIDENAQATPRNADGTSPITDKRLPHDDPRWPAACACGELFADDERQVNELDWYEGGGHRFAWGIGSWDGPPGAMIRTEYRDRQGRPPAWTVFLPNGAWWNTNDPSTPGDGSVGQLWDVSGEAPRITVSPSINDQGSRPWHGWIRDGVAEPA